MKSRILFIITALVLIAVPIDGAGAQEQATPARPAEQEHVQGEESVTGRIALNDAEQIAVLASISGTVVTKNIETLMFEAVSEKEDAKGCSSVTVTILSAASKEIRKYNVCNGLITGDVNNYQEIGSLSWNLDDFIYSIARKAYQYGMAQGLYRNLTIKAENLLGKEKCEVEVAVYDGSTMLEKLYIDPCDESD